MRITRDRIHLEPDGVLLIGVAGPILIRSETVREMIEALLDSADPTSGEVYGIRPHGGRMEACYTELTQLLEMAGVADAGSGTAQAPRPREGHVLIAGNADWVPALAEELAHWGIAHLSFWHPEPGGNCDAATSPEALCSRIKSMAPDCITRLHACADGGWDLPPDVGLVVGALAPVRVGRQVELERACRAVRIAFLGAEIVGTRGCIGPISLPGTVGCWLCARQRRRAHDPDPEAVARVDRLTVANYPPLPWDVARCFGQSVAVEVRRHLRSTAERSLRAHVRIVDVSGQTSALHGFVPMPWCGTCGADDPALSRPDLSTTTGEPDVETIRAAFRDWIDPETGPIVGPVLRELPQFAHKTFVAVAEIAPFCAFRTNPTLPEPASGKGMTEGDAVLGAIGEAFERYAASRCDLDALVQARMAELDGQVLDPRQVGMYDKAQYASQGFPFAPFDREAVHFWSLAKNLRTGAKTWVLASQLYYKFPSVFSDFVAQVTSSGLAAGTDVESATMRAVLELIERDAIMVAWLCREPGRRLPINLCDAETRYIAGELMSAGASVAFHLLEGAGKIPVVLCAATGDGVSWPGLSATAAAHPSLRLAARGAVLEQAVSGFGLMRMLREGSGPRPMRPEEVRCGQFLDHACYYVPKREEELAFLRNAPSYEPEVESYDRPIPSLAELAARLAGDGVEIAVADLTPPDVASASIHVVRAVAAGLQPLHCGFGMEFRGSWRLRHWWRKALNPAPHPFC